MADTEAVLPPPAVGPSRSTSSRPDMEGIGKFKVRQYPRSSAPPPRGGSSYKAKFFVLKETYDAVTARREELSRELELANAKLKAVQEENDLLLDAMQIVAHTQPTLVTILQQMDAESLSISDSDVYAAPPRHIHPQSNLAPTTLPEPEQHSGVIIDAASLNGNGHGHGYTHHAPVHATNGRSRSAREFRDPIVDEPADHEMLDDDALLAERELQREHHREQDYPIAPPGTDGR